MKKITIGTMFVLFIFLLFASVSAVDSNGDGVSITPSPAYDNQDITCSYNFDLGDNLPIYTWEKNSNEQGITTATVDASYLNAGDDWTCIVSYEQYTGGYPAYIEIEIGEETIEIQDSQATTNAAPIMLGGRIEVDEGETAVMDIQILDSQADFLAVYVLALFGWQADSVYIYDADGDAMDLEVDGQSGFDGVSMSGVSSGGNSYNWQTDSNDEGFYTDWVSVDDGEAITMVPFYVTVNDVPVIQQNNCPVINGVSGVFEVMEGGLIDLHVSASDVDGDPLTYVWDGIPGGVAVDEDYTWQTAVGDAGVYPVTIYVDDGECEVSVDIVLTVLEDIQPNTCPVVLMPAVGTYYEGDFVDFTVGASDADGDPLTFAWTNSVGTTSGNTFTWQTAIGDAGVYTVEVVVSDGDPLCDQTVTITFEVLENIGPTNTCPDVNPVLGGTYYEGELVERQAVASDVDGDTLTYNWIFQGLPVPGEWFVWQTTDGDEGTYNIELEVSDGICTSTTDFTIVILDDYVQENHPPEVEDIEDVHVDEGEYIEIEVVAIDPDGDALTYTFEGLDDGTANDNVWSWQTECDDAGRYYLTVSVSDGEFVVSQIVEVKVDNVLECEVPHDGISNYEGGLLGATNMFVMNAADLASWYCFDADVVVSGDYRYSNGCLSNVALDNEIVLSMTMENRNSFDARDILVTFIFDGEHSYAAFPDLDRSDSETALYRIEIPDDMESGRYGLKVIIENDDMYEERVFNLDVQSMADVIEFEVNEPVLESFWDKVEEFINSIF